MILQEEYLRRHSIVVPEVHHTVNGGSLILRPDEANTVLSLRWVVVNVEWRFNSHHPGNYTLKVLTPVHNSGRGPDLFTSIPGYPSWLTLNYDEFEQFFVLFAGSLGKIKAVTDYREASLLGWEMFCYTHDSYLSQRTSSVFHEVFATSIDFDLPLESRYYAYREAVDLLMVQDSTAFDLYESSIHSYTQRSLSWLARLINKV